jgi:DNA-binding transcriptional ArsR family regulator
MDALFTIKDLETLKVVSDPLRMRIIDTTGLANQLGELRTVKQIAAELDTEPARLYYHINLLEKHGLIKVADTQVVSGIIEKHYQVAALSITIDRELFASGVTQDEKTEAMMALLDSTLDAVRADMLRLVRTIGEDEGAATRFSGQSGQITRENARLSPAQAREFNERLLALMAEFREMSPPKGEGGLIYGLTVVFNPVIGDDLPATDIRIEDTSRRAEGKLRKAEG